MLGMLGPGLGVLRRGLEQWRVSHSVMMMGLMLYMYNRTRLRSTYVVLMWSLGRGAGTGYAKTAKVRMLQATVMLFLTIYSFSEEIIQSQCNQRAVIDMPHIKGAYRRLAREYHPDKNPEMDIEQFRELTSAHEELKRVRTCDDTILSKSKSKWTVLICNTARALTQAEAVCEFTLSPKKVSSHMRDAIFLPAVPKGVEMSTGIHQKMVAGWFDTLFVFALVLTGIKSIKEEAIRMAAQIMLLLALYIARNFFLMAFTSAVAMFWGEFVAQAIALLDVFVFRFRRPPERVAAVQPVVEHLQSGMSSGAPCEPAAVEGQPADELEDEVSEDDEDDDDDGLWTRWRKRVRRRRKEMAMRRRRAQQQAQRDAAAAAVVATLDETKRALQRQAFDVPLHSYHHVGRKHTRDALLALAASLEGSAKEGKHRTRHHIDGDLVRRHLSDLDAALDGAKSTGMKIIGVVHPHRAAAQTCKDIIAAVLLFATVTVVQSGGTFAAEQILAQVPSDWEAVIRDFLPVFLKPHFVEAVYWARVVIEDGFTQFMLVVNTLMFVVWGQRMIAREVTRGAEMLLHSTGVRLLGLNGLQAATFSMGAGLAFGLVEPGWVMLVLIYLLTSSHELYCEMLFPKNHPRLASTCLFGLALGYAIRLHWIRQLLYTTENTWMLVPVVQVPESALSWLYICLTHLAFRLMADLVRSWPSSIGSRIGAVALTGVLGWAFYVVTKQLSMCSLYWAALWLFSLAEDFVCVVPRKESPNSS